MVWQGVQKLVPTLCLSVALSGCAEPDEPTEVVAGDPIGLCFHGAGRSSEDWTQGEMGDMIRDLEGAGFPMVCPSSVDRDAERWDNTNSTANQDVMAVDALLSEMDIAVGRPLFLLGHSNGGGFTSRYAVYSERSADVVAVQVSNASGLTSIFEDAAYAVPTLFAYAACDVSVPPEGVLSNRDLLASRGVATETFALDDAYGADPYCHAFLSTSSVTVPFLQEQLPSSE